jgi:hypothetical protein
MSAMPTRANADDEAALVAYATALADAIDDALPGWVHRSVERFVPVTGAVATAVADAGERARARVAPEVRALLATDLDEQTSTPLAIVRLAVREPTEVLQSLGVAPVARDEFEERAFPDDVYGLTPATFADVDPALHEPGLRWGAAKAFVFKERRRREGKR